MTGAGIEGCCAACVRGLVYLCALPPSPGCSHDFLSRSPLPLSLFLCFSPFASPTAAAARAFPNPDMEAAALIYNYQPVYTEALDPGFEQCYFFDA